MSQSHFAIRHLKDGVTPENVTYAQYVCFKLKFGCGASFEGAGEVPPSVAPPSALTLVDSGPRHLLAGSRVMKEAGGHSSCVKINQIVPIYVPVYGRLPWQCTALRCAELA